MSTRDIVWAPDKVLKTKCTPVENIDDEIRQILDDMLETMYDAPGIGLAAPQVGLTKRLIVIDVAAKGEEPQPLKLVNPEISWSSDELSTYEEGCLSLPGHYAEVTRPAEVKVRYLDESGEEREIAADGLLATCLQHEIDHIDGILFIDHLSALKRNMILRKMTKAKKQRAEDKAA
ncbi:peptide deformylase [Nisaea acidiphila]|uniref:Peptide deformylase n=1 Tax=Nisaea acidiphila TaxID=1862145 RepID=A0A9J7AYW2_9PROT|nr:peptide deformylase [Nisaea acidiphila]UUX51978.1 peptide deformylase [Nisaea acidiphila]